MQPDNGQDDHGDVLVSSASYCRFTGIFGEILHRCPRHFIIDNSKGSRSSIVIVQLRVIVSSCPLTVAVCAAYFTPTVGRMYVTPLAYEMLLDVGCGLYGMDICRGGFRDINLVRLHSIACNKNSSLSRRCLSMTCSHGIIFSIKTKADATNEALGC